MAKAILTAERLREVMHYDPETGILVWKRNTGRKKMVGKLAGAMRNGYVIVGVDGVRYEAHRLAWLYMTGRFPRAQIDHIDCDRSNNVFSNLREVSNAENQQNRRTAHKDSKSGYMGVSWNVPGKKWTARICVDRKQMYLGLFDTPELAHEVYLKAKRELHEFCSI